MRVLSVYKIHSSGNSWHNNLSSILKSVETDHGEQQSGRKQEHDEHMHMLWCNKPTEPLQWLSPAPKDAGKSELVKTQCCFSMLAHNDGAMDPLPSHKRPPSFPALLPLQFPDVLKLLAHYSTYRPHVGVHVVVPANGTIRTIRRSIAENLERMRWVEEHTLRSAYLLDQVIWIRNWMTQKVEATAGRQEVVVRREFFIWLKD